MKHTYVKNGVPASALRLMNAEARVAICSSSSARVTKLKSSTGVTGDPATPSQIFGTSAPDSANSRCVLYMDSSEVFLIPYHSSKP